MKKKLNKITAKLNKAIVILRDVGEVELANAYQKKAIYLYDLIEAGKKYQYVEEDKPCLH